MKTTSTNNNYNNLVTIDDFVPRFHDEVAFRYSQEAIYGKPDFISETNEIKIKSQGLKGLADFSEEAVTEVVKQIERLTWDLETTLNDSVAFARIRETQRNEKETAEAIALRNAEDALYYLGNLSIVFIKKADKELAMDYTLKQFDRLDNYLEKHLYKALCCDEDVAKDSDGFVTETVLKIDSEELKNALEYLNGLVKITVDIKDKADFPIPPIKNF